MKAPTRLRWLAALLLWLLSPFLLIQAQPVPPGGGPPCTNCPAIAATFSAGRSVIDLEIRHAGTLRLELYDREKPASVSNFLGYVLSGRYTNNLIHRAATNFVLQGGSLQILDFGGGSKAVVPVEEFAPVTNELGRGQFFSNQKGTIALAHYPHETNNATCHWFINLTNNAHLDAPTTNAAYTVFGRVIGGTNILDRLNPAAANTLVKVLNLTGYLEEAPVRPAATLATATYDDLLLATYRVVKLDMQFTIEKLAGQARKVTWRSLSNQTHKVEFLPTLGGTNWLVLWTTNGNGNLQSYQHTPTNTNGFYRVTF